MHLIQIILFMSGSRVKINLVLKLSAKFTRPNPQELAEVFYRLFLLTEPANLLILSAMLLSLLFFSSLLLFSLLSLLSLSTAVFLLYSTMLWNGFGTFSGICFNIASWNTYKCWQHYWLVKYADHLHILIYQFLL